jgi:hypothetical protein
MRTTHSRFTGAGAALVAGLAAVALGACGGAEGGGDGAAGDRERMEQAALKHAQCMRDHGVDVPDPKPGAGGGMVMVGPGAGGDPAEQRRAIEACAKHMRDVPPPRLSEEQKTEMRDAALAHARCMREHGIDFPDPQFGPDGSITVKIGEGGPNPDDPKMRAAEQACSKLMPKIGDAAPEETGDAGP